MGQMLATRRRGDAGILSGSVSATSARWRESKIDASGGKSRGCPGKVAPGICRIPSRWGRIPVGEREARKRGGVGQDRARWSRWGRIPVGAGARYLQDPIA